MTVISRPTIASRVVDPVVSPLWRSLALQEHATLFHSPTWMAALQACYGLEFSAAVIEEPAGRPAAGVAWCDMADLLGRRRVTLPFSDFCDVLGRTPQERCDLARAAMQGAPSWTLRTREGNRPPGLPAPAMRTPYKWHGIGLLEEEACLWRRLTPAAQRGVRKALKNNVTVESATDLVELRAFFLLHLRLRKQKYHLLAQPYAFFERLWDLFVSKGDGFLLVAKHGGRTIAGTLFLVWGNRCYYKFNASDPEAQSLRPNNLLMWRGILEAKARGCTLLDLGRSSASHAGLIFFKTSFGAQEEDLFTETYHLDKGDHAGPDDGKLLLHNLTEVFVQDGTPDGLTEQAGALLYRYFG